MKRKGCWMADLRKAYKQPRPNRNCPRCGKRTEVDGDGKARCRCGWHTGMALTLPPAVKLVDPAREVGGK